MSKKYKLKAALFGHSLDVRSVVATEDNAIISGSRDRTAKYWKPAGFNAGYGEVMSYKDQKNFVMTVLYLGPSTNYPDGLVITGGNDNCIYIYKPSEPFSSFTIKNHSNAVSCLNKCVAPNMFLSGSWDTTAKLWQLESLTEAAITFSGHQAAIWGVIQLQDTRIVTASADKSIIIWTNQGQQQHVLKGHTDCVRGLADFPESQQFASVSNDASIRVWSYSGEIIQTYYGHTNYIYSIARCKALGDSCFVTSDEDRTVRFWENGINNDTFQLPAQSVWSVACLPNGDVVTGSSDGVVRVFTRDESQVADEATLTKFNEDVEALARQSMQEIGGYKVSDLPGKEALYDPGKKAGQMKMIREGHGVVAYTWVESGDGNHWEKVGEVVGSNDKAEKNTFEGKSYDFVFSVDVEDGKPPLKLPYNNGQDPYQAANEFLARNSLPSTYLEQVVDFILKNSKAQMPVASSDYVDPFTGGSRYTPGSGGHQQGFTGANLDPFTGGNSYSTSLNQPKSAASGGASDVKYFPLTAYRSFEMGDVKVILDKLKEFNKKSGDGNSAIDETFLEELVKLCNGPPTDPNSFDILFKLLDWPDEIVFPVLDVIRLAVRHGRNNEIITAANNGILIQKLMTFIHENCKVQNNAIVALRTLGNLCLHESGEELMFENRFDIVENITAYPLSGLNKSGQVALATLLLNLSILVLKRNDELGMAVLADVIPDILAKLNDPESQFRAYVALGTLLTSAKPQQVEEIKEKIKGNAGFVSALQFHVLSGQNDLENKRRNCAKQVETILTFSF